MRKLYAVLLISLSACASAPAVEPSEPTVSNVQPEPAPETAAGLGVGGAAAPEPAPLLPNAHEPLPSVVTGGAPSEQQLQAAQQAGYKTVISLLPDTAPEAEQVRGLGMQFVSIPVAGPQDLTEDNARKLAQAMDAAGSKPLLLHCASGNRAGALLALKAFYVDGDSAQDALKLGEAAGLASLRPSVEAAMQKPAPAP